VGLNDAMPRTNPGPIGPEDPLSPPCISCGTKGGLIHPKAKRPARARGMCHACYMRDYYRRTKGKAPYEGPELWNRHKAYRARVKALAKERAEARAATRARDVARHMTGG
jgi:hypothetical protein